MTRNKPISRLTRHKTLFTLHPNNKNLYAQKRRGFPNPLLANSIKTPSYRLAKVPQLLLVFLPLPIETCPKSR